MAKYGDTAEMQKLAWGGAKASTPDRVTAEQNSITAMINIILNRTEDYATVPDYINQIANTVVGEILRPSEKPLTKPETFHWLKLLLMNYMDQAPEGETNWGNIRWV
jgi:hypothetical protein